MCGKFTAQRKWCEVFDFSQPLTGDVGGDSDGDSSGEVDTNRVDGPLPVITWDAVPRRPHALGLPDPKDWRRPRPILARSETVDIKDPSARPFTQASAASSSSKPSTKARRPSSRRAGRK
jgi:hypothetical protein